MNTLQAAQYLGITIKTLEYHIALCRIIPTYGSRGRRVFSQAALDAFQQTRRGPGRPPKQLTAQTAQ